RGVRPQALPERRRSRRRDRSRYCSAVRPRNSCSRARRRSAPASPTRTPAARAGRRRTGTGERRMTTPGHDANETWPLWEVFVRADRGLSHVHAGSLHAPDAAMALRNARDLYTRRGEGVSLWVVPSSAITASSPDERDPFFEPAADKPYRHPTFYDVPEGVKHL